MNYEYLENKKIVILGYGIENKALVEFLIKKKVKAEITICDARAEVRKEIKGVKWNLGKNYDKNLDRFDIVSRVAGYPLFSEEIKKALVSGAEVTSPVKLFFEFSPTKNIIGVTGTKGKGTTSSLIFEIIKKAQKKVFWGGNIGIPIFGFMDKIKSDDWVVLELSSFLLEDFNISPRLAVITNFTKDHLAPADPNNPNYHKSLKEYRQAKNNIIKFQKPEDVAILNEKLEIKNWKLGQGKIIKFGKSELENELVGEHNKENIAAAVEAARIIGIKNEIIKKTVKNFKGLNHRLQKVAYKKDITYYNDSFATTPEAAMTALNSFSSPIILLAGGAEKNLDFKKLARVIKSRVIFVVLLRGKATPRLKREILRV
ncbi:UDP-N-acetylmuramoyl-L-alanine--D-glutamate ligase, partial [Candidatus Falkowbacteria bacterium]